MPAITIRPLESHQDFADLEDLQRVIWPGNDLTVIPSHFLSSATQNGAVAVGAFDGERLVGFAFGILGTDGRESNRPALARLKCYSHQLGVHPEYRSHGVGRQLKLAQRQWAVDLGIRLITWTYDPLESRNAHLNLSLLGCVCQTYKTDYYGEIEDGLNWGLPTDRFVVDWWITSNRVQQRTERTRPAVSEAQLLLTGAARVNPVTRDEAGWVVPPAEPVWPEGALALVEIPSDFQTLKKQDLALARRWRMHTREVFLGLFAAGWLVTDFVHERGDYPRSMYLLAQSE